MSGSKGFVLDANVFITAYQQYYRFDVCPGFWDALVRQHEAQRVCSIDRVRDELLALDDALTQWTKRSALKAFFKGTADKAVIDAFREMVNWVQNENQFTDAAKAEFAAVADGWVVAYAQANGLTVATLEEYAADVKKKVPIPNLCLEFKVDYVNTLKC
jgi:hypothetical protein